MRAAVYDRYGPAPGGAARGRDRAAATGPRRGARAHARVRRQPDRLAGRAAARRAARRRLPTWCRTRTGPARSTPWAPAFQTRSSAAACGCTSRRTTASTDRPRNGCACRSTRPCRSPTGRRSTSGASLGIPALTAHRCLFADGPVQGRTVLVAGGAGAVGHFAIELGRRAGARIIATVSSDEKAALARAAGADAVVNYRSEDAAESSGPPRPAASIVWSRSPRRRTPRSTSRCSRPMRS